METFNLALFSICGGSESLLTSSEVKLMETLHKGNGHWGIFVIDS